MQEVTIHMERSKIERINALLDIHCFDEMTDEEMSVLGARKDTYEGGFVVNFEDGSSMTWDLCSGGSNYYDNVIWTSADGEEEVVLDCSYELSDIEFEVEGENYFVKIVSV